MLRAPCCWHRRRMIGRRVCVQCAPKTWGERARCWHLQATLHVATCHWKLAHRRLGRSGRIGRLPCLSKAIAICLKSKGSLSRASRASRASSCGLSCGCFLPFSLSRTWNLRKDLVFVLKVSIHPIRCGNSRKLSQHMLRHRCGASGPDKCCGASGPDLEIEPADVLCGAIVLCCAAVLCCAVLCVYAMCRCVCVCVLCRCACVCVCDVVSCMDVLCCGAALYLVAACFPRLTLVASKWSRVRASTRSLSLRSSRKLFRACRA